MTILGSEFHGRCLVVAHRGASAEQPENTLAAFQAAQEAGADVVELDVRVTADGIPVVLHDLDVSATTDGTGLVHELTFSEIKRLDASGGTGSAEAVPSLEEALELIGRLGGAVDLEIKNLPGEPAFDSPKESVLVATLNALEATSFPGEALVSSFNWLTIERSKELAPDIPTGFLTVAAIDPRAALVYVTQHGHEFVLPQTPGLLDAGERFVGEAHAEQVRVGTWVADDDDLLATLFSWGVDAVATNDPARAVALRDRAPAGEAPQ